MKRKIRKILAVLILVISLSLLLWGLWPEARKTLIQPIGPNQMQLPTPVSFYMDSVPQPFSADFGPAGWYLS